MASTKFCAVNYSLVIKLLEVDLLGPVADAITDGLEHGPGDLLVDEGLHGHGTESCRYTQCPHRAVGPCELDVQLSSCLHRFVDRATVTQGVVFVIMRHGVNPFSVWFLRFQP